MNDRPPAPNPFNRRKFLGASAILAGATSILPSYAAAAGRFGRKKMISPVRRSD